MFDMPDAIAFGTLMISAGGVGITAICRFGSNIKNDLLSTGKPSNGNGSVSETLCQARWGNLKEDIQEIRKDTREIRDTLGEIKDLKSILSEKSGTWPKG